MHTLSDRLYRVLLALYPADFRREYGLQMAQLFRDQRRAMHGQGMVALGLLWWRTLSDVAVTLVIEQLASRKARMINAMIFKNHPDRLTSLLFLLPGLVLSLFYLLTIHSGESTGYLLAALVGVTGFGLGFLKIIRPVRIWEQFFLGFAIGSVSLFVTIIWTPMMNLGIPMLRSEPWPTVRLAVAIAVSLGAIWLLDRWTGRLRRLYWMAAAILLVNGLIWALLPVGPNEYSLWELSWNWAYSAAVLGIATIGLRLSHRFGHPALLAVLVALGMMNSVNLSLADIAVGRTPYGQITLALAYLVPLVICPAWLLLAPTWGQKKIGVLFSWAAMLAGIVLVLPVVDTFLEPHYFRYLRPLELLRGILMYAPPFVGLWLALTLYERASPGSAFGASPDHNPSGTPAKSHSQIAHDAR
jgi:hypothetical protein